jgi:predicted nucleic acid-binding protein
VSTVYVDTSALARMLLDEPDAAAVERELDTFDQRIASRLLRVELRRVGLRENRLDDADRLLAGVSLIPLEERILTAAGKVPPSTVATLDAIHLATALQVASTGQLDAVMTYDKRLTGGARAHGLTVLSPS